ncbi:ATP-dependent helicase/nuclease subunit A [Hartmannibacter diazotrophicus]|uniref:DNA 3'-5' helicase n=1 Tax=Hartmannibacter diazotrophicus TaxID=1482074 RepID=A0A2C9D003_9HYPH|nr:double-strand break repair helicase AddA [Hartmannibacter diazotrophicus]SON53574.1 ATP-dependent helicase/nuclease subunit A [Hartmannibacter diazotrophicus]
MSAPAKPIEVPERTRRDQATATHPRHSVWVSANAGSGKTYVLSRRVIRLLLAGADPAAILCLTFTKAAAAEMANRVFETLGQWTSLSDANLANELEALEGRAANEENIARARRLFARALETPGGLKIQTIHGFCEALLQRFPVEAGIAGRFKVLDDMEAESRLQQALDAVIVAASADPDSAMGRALTQLVAERGDDTIRRAIVATIHQRDAYLGWIDGAGGFDAALAGLRKALGVAEGETVAAIDRAVIAESGFDEDFVARLRTALRQGAATDQALDERFAAVEVTDDIALAAGNWLKVFMTGDGAKRQPRKFSSFCTKAIKTQFPDLEAMFEEEITRLEALEDRRAATATFERTAALIRLAGRAIDLIEAGKAASGALDFDDLILRTARLLSHSDAAAWVQYKLDQGIDHVLVDEAQDTSPRAWEVIAALTDEFFVGEGARRGSTGVRTLFAVGDEKQSIYSFQGAAPHLFGAMRRRTGKRAGEAGIAYDDVALQLSFRSTPDVVKAVDAVFARPETHQGLSADAAGTVHETVRNRDIGLVEIWPATVDEETLEPENWTDPVDETKLGSAEAQLADRIARAVRGWIARGETLPGGRPIRAGDVLVLVRKRAGFVSLLSRALTEIGVPVAGADRLQLMSHIAVMDLLALARAVLLPEDDLTLAALLKSPLIGLNEDQLFQLAHGRRTFLYERLRQEADRDVVFRAAHERLARWRGLADTIDPHAFFARVLAADAGRRAFRARLGPEVDDVLDEFLSLALSFGKDRTPSLEGFLAFAAAADHEIKREMDAARDEVRIMTVHGAKGLEAPVVFLVDQGAAPYHPSHRPLVLPLNERDHEDIGPVQAAPLVFVGSGRQAPSVEAALEAKANLAREEYRRQLYVGLTRARDRLVVCGMAPKKAVSEPRWYQMVHDALVPDATEIEGEGGDVVAWHWRFGGPERAVALAGTTAARQPVEEDTAEPAEDLPDFVRRPAPVGEAPMTLNPSSAEAVLAEIEARDVETPYPAAHALEAARAGESAALRRGSLVHRLLEALPGLAPKDREARGRRYLATSGPDFSETEREALLAKVLAVLCEPAFAPVFAPGSRAEVALAGEVMLRSGRKAEVSGQIDRLAVSKDAVLIVDFKTNRPVPDAIPENYLMQLAVYARLIADIYPGRQVRAAILWTESARLDEVPTDVLQKAIGRLF